MPFRYDSIYFSNLHARHLYRIRFDQECFLGRSRSRCEKNAIAAVIAIARYSTCQVQSTSFARIFACLYIRL